MSSSNEHLSMLVARSNIYQNKVLGTFERMYVANAIALEDIDRI